MSFGVIESPPWGFESERTEGGNTSSFLRHNTTMTGKVEQFYDFLENKIYLKKIEYL
jgi:hypothetical protein